MTSIRAIPPLPTRPEWAPAYLSARAGAINRDFAFKFQDAQGAPSRDGHRYHSGVDWFAPGGTPIIAPRSGVITRSVSSSDTTGPVFGGIVEIEGDDGLTWVMRHVQPVARVGARVVAGDVVATVMPWGGGWPHLHLELWRDRSGGYKHENMLDPSDVEWTMSAQDVSPPPAYFFEELPHTSGGAGPAIVGQKKGYASATLAKAVATTLRARGRIVSTVRGQDDRTYVLSWAPGTYGAPFRFGPWADGIARDVTSETRATNTRRPMRRFAGKSRSLYPWPKESS